MLLREHGVLEISKRARKHRLKASLGFIGRNIRHSIAANASKRFDRVLSVDTAGSLQLEYLTIEGPNANHGTEAVSTSSKSFDWMLKNIPRPLSDSTFIDIGCGKGRTLILSRSYGFHQAIGVEFALELAETAQRNLVTINRDIPGGASVVHQDAAQYEFPRGSLFASWKERKPVTAALKQVYRAKDAETARQKLDEFDAGPWGRKYPAIAQYKSREQSVPLNRL